MEFKLDKTQRLVVNTTAEEQNRPILRCIHVKKGMIEATNKCIMIQRKIDYDGDEELLLDKDDIAHLIDSKGLRGVVFTTEGDKVKTLGEDTRIFSPVIGNFFDLGKLYSDQIPILKIALSRKLLLKLLKSLGKDEDVIRFYFHSDQQMVEFEVGDNIRGGIMPMNVEWKKK